MGPRLGFCPHPGLGPSELRLKFRLGGRSRPPLAAALRPTAVKASAFSETAARQAVAPVRVSMRTASEEQDGGKMAATGGEETEEAEEYGQRNKNNALGLTRGRGNVHARHRR